jgi:uncharacterized protein YbaP (TraB family)
MFSSRRIGAFLGAIGTISLSMPAAASAPTTPAPTARPPVPAATESETPIVPRPAIWLVADEDTRIYLFGTIHVLPPGLQWRSPVFDNVVAQVDELVMEIGEDPADTELAAMASSVMIGKQVPILWRVSPDRREALRAMIESVDLPVDTFDGMQTWAAAMSIAVAAIAKAYTDEGGTIEQLGGVEDALRADFARAGRPVSGVETGTQQLGFLSGLPLRSQRQMLEAMVDAYVAGDLDMTAPNENGWLTGDIDGIATEMAELPPEVYEVLITRRNTTWTGWLLDRMERPGTVLFAVGAGHLAGRDSVQSMLAARGVQVTRLN